MALFLVRALGLAPAGNTEPTFADIDESHHAYEAIEALYASGITTGCTTEPPLYCPDRDVTRSQMAAFLSRAMTRTDG